jgi:phosphoglucosamine mutase
LFLSNVLVSEEKTLSSICGIMSKYPQVLINAKVKNENKNMYLKDEQIIQEINKIEEMLDGQGRVLIRPSGTEPLVRVMLEGKEEGQLHSLASELANLIESKLA